MHLSRQCIDFFCNRVKTRQTKHYYKRVIQGAGGPNEMKICVLGGDGYCGWATALYLSGKGHTVSVVDNYARRQWDHELGVQTLTPIQPMADRLRAWHDLTGRTIELFVGDVMDHDFLASTIESF